MRRTLPFLALLLIAAKKPKNDAPAAPEAPPPPPPAAAPVEAPPEAPPPAPEAPAHPKNASLNVTLTWADGHTRAGKVTGIERSTDFYADEGWTDEDGKLRLEVDDGKKMVAWKDVKTINIAPGKIPDDVDCNYSSDFTPWMYECTLRTTAAIVMKDGSKGVITNRYLWRFSFEDGASETFSIFKYTEREQDEGNVDYSSEVAENMGLYTKLQDRLRTNVKSAILKSITVQ